MAILALLLGESRGRGGEGGLLRGGFHRSGDFSPLAWLTLSVTAMS